MSLKRESIAFFLANVCLLFSLSLGYLDAYDASASVQTALSLVERGTFEVPQQDPTLYREGPGKRIFSKMGSTLPLLYIPAVLLSKVLSPNPHWELRLREFFISLINPLLTAILLTLLYAYFRPTGTILVALGIALTAGYATLLLPYSKTSHREPLQALCLLGAFLALAPDREPPSSKRFFVAGLLLGTGILTKLAFFVPALPPLLYGTWAAFRSKSKARGLLAFFGPLVLFALWQLSFARWAWGSWVATGYGPKVTRFTPFVWRFPLGEGIWLQLLSLRSGLFVYSPVLLAVPCWIVSKVRAGRFTSFDGALLVSCLLQLTLYAKWYSPTGDEALGPRYLVVIIPLLFVAVARAPALESLGRPGRWILGALIGISVAIQGVNTSVKIQQYYTLQQRAGRTFPCPHWLANWKILAHKSRGLPERYPLSLFGVPGREWVDVTDIPSLAGFNFWWWHAGRFL